MKNTRAGYLIVIGAIISPATRGAGVSGRRRLARWCPLRFGARSRKNRFLAGAALLETLPCGRGSGWRPAVGTLATDLPSTRLRVTI